MSRTPTPSNRLSTRERWLATGLLASLAATLTLVFAPRAAPRAAAPSVETAPGAEALLEPGLPEAASDAVASGPQPGLGPAPACYLGVVLASESVDVVAEVDGRVREVRVRPGDEVEAGALLVALEDEALGRQLAIGQSNLTLIEAEVQGQALQLEQAQRVHRRRRAVEGLLSREEAERSEVDVEVSRYRLEVAEAELVQARVRVEQLEADLARLQVRAPFAGVVGMRYLDRGAVARPGAPLLRLVSREQPRARFAVPPADAAALGVGARLRVEIESLGLAVPGVVEHRNPEINAAAGLVFVESRLEPGAAEPIPPGAVARVSLVVPGSEAPSCLGRLPGRSESPGTNRLGRHRGAAARRRDEGPGADLGRRLDLALGLHPLPELLR